MRSRACADGDRDVENESSTRLSITTLLGEEAIRAAIEAEGITNP
jgi:hypothetical protein